MAQASYQVTKKAWINNGNNIMVNIHSFIQQIIFEYLCVRNTVQNTWGTAINKTNVLSVGKDRQ